MSKVATTAPKLATTKVQLTIFEISMNIFVNFCFECNPQISPPENFSNVTADYIDHLGKCRLIHITFHRFYKYFFVICIKRFQMSTKNDMILCNLYVFTVVETLK